MKRPNRRAASSSASQLQAAKLPAPRGLRANRFRLGVDELVVFSFPLSEPRIPDDLTSAEREVVLHMLQGLSNSGIASKRGTSTRTVANQIAAIFRKLGVASRAELAHRLMSTPDEGKADG